VERTIYPKSARERPDIEVTYFQLFINLQLKHPFSVDIEAKKVEMTLRSGDLSKSSSSLAIADLKEGQKVDGVVTRIEDYGLFIQIDKSKLTGLCHKSQV
jgi:polyribonucleotide nucleotidyltransferase